MRLGADDLADMPLRAADLPPPFHGFSALRERTLDNETMARHGFPGSDAERFRRAGRIDGYMREFAAPAHSLEEMDGGADFMAATVAHLFETPDDVRRWMRDVFVKDFEDNVGVELRRGQKLVGVETLAPSGFFDDAAALKALHRDGDRLISVTIVDFRIGRILGVAFVGSLGDAARLEEASELAMELEKRIVSVALS